MTEIPEHLLARSRARREAAGLGGEAATPSTGSEVEVASAATPAPAAAATPATRPAAAPPAPPIKPDPPYVRAYKERKKIPWWAMPVVALLPVWAFIYANTMVPPSAGASDPLTLGGTLYQSNCASCHGANGQGGVGPSFQNKAVTTTWPNFKDHILWVQVGSGGWPGTTYGAPQKPIGSGGMPSFKALPPGEIALIVRYEREVLAKADPEPALVALTETAATGGDVSASLETAPSADPTKPAG